MKETLAEIGLIFVDYMPTKPIMITTFGCGQKAKKGVRMKQLLLVFGLAFLVGCESGYKNNAYTPKTGSGYQNAVLSDLKLGMQIFEIQEIHKKELVPIAFESRQGYDLAQYQGRFYNEEQAKPYKLTFEIYPPLTRIQCQYIAAKNNITDPNEIAKVMALEGYRPNRLVKVEEDIGAIAVEAKQAQQSRKSLKNFIQEIGIAAEGVGDPHFYEKQRQWESDEELRQAYLKRLDGSNHPLTQADIALLEQIQNKQYQRQYLGHLKRMEEMKEQELKNQQQELHDQQFERMRIKRLIPDGRGGYIIE